MNTVSNTRIRIGLTLAWAGLALCALDAAGLPTVAWAAFTFSLAWAIASPSLPPSKLPPGIRYPVRYRFALRVAKQQAAKYDGEPQLVPLVTLAPYVAQATAEQGWNATLLYAHDVLLYAHDVHRQTPRDR